MSSLSKENKTWKRSPPIVWSMLTVINSYLEVCLEFTIYDIKWTFGTSLFRKKCIFKKGKKKQTKHFINYYPQSKAHGNY